MLCCGLDSRPRWKNPDRGIRNPGWKNPDQIITAWTNVFQIRRGRRMIFFSLRRRKLVQYETLRKNKMEAPSPSWLSLERPSSRRWRRRWVRWSRRCAQSAPSSPGSASPSSRRTLEAQHRWRCTQRCGTVTNFYGSGSDFWHITVPDPDLVPDLYLVSRPFIADH